MGEKRMYAISRFENNVDFVPEYVEGEFDIPLIKPETYDEEEDKSIVVTLEQIAEKGYDLSPNKYVKYHKEETKPYATVLAEFKAAYQQMIDAEKKFRNILNREAV